MDRASVSETEGRRFESGVAFHYKNNNMDTLPITDGGTGHTLVNFDFLLGKTEAVAFELVQDHDYSPRVVRRDGVSRVITADLRLDRVNLVVVENLVVSWYVG